MIRKSGPEHNYQLRASFKCHSDFVNILQQTGIFSLVLFNNIYLLIGFCSNMLMTPIKKKLFKKFIWCILFRKPGYKMTYWAFKRFCKQSDWKQSVIMTWLIDHPVCPMMAQSDIWHGTQDRLFLKGVASLSYES